ncbi:Acyltransferase family protein [Rubellimicrobium mesophilum DSM 19309]|uniref:Acyltransferase family protein n=1 Tax=Rubellimicrobium mesophilum DSM 19309 TaxID=442562 RepID=A0A017HJV1_9RHOB|nr:lysophospholipid acyltransferase family protein [Rubellimicrobium mesophilum]EYD74590.1 Acyltransferase family protein [Rubellimicrobium mesophilum DSM 19309]
MRPARPLRAALFKTLIYGAMPVYALAYLPWALLDRNGAVAACHAWCRFVRWAARAVVGIESEVRGTPPTGEVLIAAKHQSFLDIILIYGAVPRGRFIMKKELLWTPILGQYALRIGCVPVDRGKRGQAIRKMVADVAAGRADPGQLIIYPQGTRVAPGVRASYKAGAAALYGELGQPCVPVACNVGLFWPRSGNALRPGRAVVEFLPPIPPGLSSSEFLKRLEAEVEPASDRLMAEAGFGA